MPDSAETTTTAAHDPASATKHEDQGRGLVLDTEPVRTIGHDVGRHVSAEPFTVRHGWAVDRGLRGQRRGMPVRSLHCPRGPATSLSLLPLGVIEQLGKRNPVHLYQRSRLFLSPPNQCLVRPAGRSTEMLLAPRQIRFPSGAGADRPPGAGTLRPAFGSWRAGRKDVRFGRKRSCLSVDDGQQHDCGHETQISGHRQ